MLTFLDSLDLGGIARPSRLNTRRRPVVILLHLASSLGLTPFGAGLLSRGANSNAVDKIGNTPLHFAALNAHPNIIHRLRLAGADHKIRSIRGFIIADLALSLREHQAALIPRQRIGSSRTRSRRASAVSLEGDSDYLSDDCESSDTDGLSRPSSGPTEQSMDEPQAAAISPAHYMSAWRDSLAAQILQFQESASWAMPNLNLPALPNLPDYQAYPMVRRVSFLFPQRPAPSDSLAGVGPASPMAPPAYNELSPKKAEKSKDDDLSINKASASRAAADAALDHHFGTVESFARDERDMR